MSDLVKQLREEQAKQQQLILTSACAAIGGFFSLSVGYLLYSAANDFRVITKLSGGEGLPMPQQLYACMSYLCAIVGGVSLVGAGTCAIKVQLNNKKITGLEYKILKNSK